MLQLATNLMGQAHAVLALKGKDHRVPTMIVLVLTRAGSLHLNITKKVKQKRHGVRNNAERKTYNHAPKGKDDPKIVMSCARPPMRLWVLKNDISMHYAV